MTAPALRVLTDCGLPGIHQIPYGLHMCSFYRSREELAAALVPYFLAGLRSHERCLWITAEPLPAADALAELRRAGFNPDAYLESSALVVRDYSNWYTAGTTLRGADVVKLWLEEERRALAAGYQGLRITGNVTFLQPHDWPLFMEYEDAVQRTFHGRRILTLCTYDLSRCNAAELLDVMRRHSCTLDRPDEGWQILTNTPA